MNRVGLCIISPTILILGFMFGVTHFGNTTEYLAFNSENEAYLFLIRRLTIYVSIMVGVIFYIYIFHIRKHSKRYADALAVSVEGSFLRIRENVGRLVDRKIHFRSIVDYSNIQSPMMNRYGIQSLKMNTTSGGQNSTIKIEGIENCLKVRDILSDIDQQRERG
jgi:membrane protein YdbS with pleckstrin-like domain